MNSKLNCSFVALTLLLGLVACECNAESNIAVKAFVTESAKPAIIPGVLTLIAGNMEGPGAADGFGSNAHFSNASSDIGINPKGIVADASGNLYVADVGNQTIRKVSISGVVTTLAGKAGIPGSADGIGAEARFNYPTGIAIDAIGNLYVADSSNYTIRKISPIGVVTTVAGKARVIGWQDGKGSEARFRRPEGIVVNKDSGVIYVSDTFNGSIRQISPQGVVTTFAGRIHEGWGFADGRGTAARFNQPEGITIDRHGILYVADHGNKAIRKILPNGEVTTLVGPPHPTGGNEDGPLNIAQISDPSGIGIDAAGNLYVTTTRQLRKISTDGIVSTVAGEENYGGHVDAIGRAASFEQPGGITADDKGNLFMADNTTVRKITPSGSVTTLAGTATHDGSADGIGGNAQFNSPIELTSDNMGNLYVADRGNGVIRKVSANGAVTTLAGNPSQEGEGYADGIGHSAKFAAPTGIAVDGAGNVYVCDMDNQVIRKITPDGVVTTVAGEVGEKGIIDGIGKNARFDQPVEMASDKAGNLYVVDSNTLRRIDRASNVYSFPHTPTERGHKDGTGSEVRFDHIHDITVDITGNLYVIDADMIRKISPKGVVTTLGHYADTLMVSDTQSVSFLPEGITTDEVGNVYYSVHSKIREINPQGIVIAEIDATGPESLGLETLSVLENPSSLTFLGHRTLALITNNAVLKLTLPMH